MFSFAGKLRLLIKQKNSVHQTPSSLFTLPKRSVWPVLFFPAAYTFFYFPCLGWYMSLVCLYR